MSAPVNGQLKAKAGDPKISLPKPAVRGCGVAGRYVAQWCGATGRYVARGCGVAGCCAVAGAQGYDTIGVARWGCCAIVGSCAIVGRCVIV